VVRGEPVADDPFAQGVGVGDDDDALTVVVGGDRVGD